jgi:hypothetical protein
MLDVILKILKKRLMIIMLYGILIVFVASAVSGHAAVTTGYINWTGDAGYTAEIKFRFDESVPIISAVTDFSKTTRLENSGLIDLWTTIRDQQGNLVTFDLNEQSAIYTAQMVQDGHLMGFYSYFKFFFDTQNLSIPSGQSIDVGPFSHYWIWGTSAGYQIQSDTPDGNITVDSGSNFQITIVPEPSGLVLSISALGVMLTRRKR